jgi:hypothetical protein
VVQRWNDAIATGADIWWSPTLRAALVLLEMSNPALCQLKFGIPIEHRGPCASPTPRTDIPAAASNLQHREPRAHEMARRCWAPFGPMGGQAPPSVACTT